MGGRIEGDYGYTNARGGNSCPNQNGFTCNSDADQLGSTGRLGYTWGRALFYGKGGLAVGEVSLQTQNNAGSATAPSGTPFNGSSNWTTGWTIGGGMEFALTDRFSAKAEYMHYDLGTDTYKVDNGLLVDGSTKGDIVRVGVNLHFNPVQREMPLK